MRTQQQARANLRFVELQIEALKLSTKIQDQLAGLPQHSLEDDKIDEVGATWGEVGDLSELVDRLRHAANWFDPHPTASIDGE